MVESAKKLLVKVIPNHAARRILDRRHPLGAGAAFTFALGVEWDGAVRGVMTFGQPGTNNAVTRWDLRNWEALELRKMWFADDLPRNSESRALAIALRILRGRYSDIALLITYCDGEDLAAAYKGAGWVACEAHRYLREVMVDGKWLSVRDANRKRVLGRATDKRYECRRKWIIGVNDRGRKIASEVQTAARATTSGEGAVQVRPRRSIFPGRSNEGVECSTAVGGNDSRRQEDDRGADLGH